MKRALLATFCLAFIAAIPATALGNASAILSQLRSIERRTRTTRTLDEAEREKYRARVRDLTRKFSDLPRRESKHTAEFGRLSASIWKNLREQSLDPRMRGLPAPPTPRDRDFARELREIQDRCRNLPKPVSDFGLLGKSKAEVVRRLREEVARFSREYRQAVQQYRADLAVVRRYQPESQSAVYRVNSTREMLEGLTLNRLQEAPGESRDVLASWATRWLRDAKSELRRNGIMKPDESAPERFEVPAEGLDPVLKEMFPNWRPGDPHPLDLPPLPEKNVSSDRPPSKAEQIVGKMRRSRLAKLEREISETLEAVWNLAHLGVGLETFIGGDPAKWEQMIGEVQEIARRCDFKQSDLPTNNTRPVVPRRPTLRSSGGDFSEPT
jgi:hypothetical protein